MAIKPQYAQAILAGKKAVEFRKRGLAPDVDTVLMYETAPTQRVVGMFKVGDTVRSTPRGLWRRFGAVGYIARGDFMSYYDRSRTAVGLVVSSVVEFANPVALADLRSTPAVPQSFVYLPVAVIAEIEDMQLGRPLNERQLLPA